MLLLLELFTILVFNACRVSNCSFFPCFISSHRVGVDSDQDNSVSVILMLCLYVTAVVIYSCKVLSKHLKWAFFCSDEHR